MLAYVFWHWPRPHVTPHEYEARVSDFHRSLSIDPPLGFRHSLTFRVDSLPWHSDKAAGYEDWYLVADWEAFDPLNAAAVSGNNRTPHDRVAQTAAGGTGGVYRLQYGTLDLTDAGFAVWLHKPEGVRYADFDDLLRAWTENVEISMWQRQMVLGPAPEYCILSRQRLTLLGHTAPLIIARHVIAVGHGPT